MRTSLISFLIAPMLLLAACGDDAESPTAPAAAEPAQVVNVTTTILRFEAINDGDGIEGAGEFYFTVTVPGVDKSWERSLNSGNSSTLNWTSTYQFQYLGSPFETFVRLRCSEIDKDITGREYNDGDMDFRYLEAKEVVPGADITNYMTMGNDECKVRLHYRITSQVVQLED